MRIEAVLRFREQPRVGDIGDLGNDKKVMNAEGLGRVPAVILPVDSAESHMMARASLGFVPPDRGFDGADPDLVNRLGFHCQSIVAGAVAGRLMSNARAVAGIDKLVMSGGHRIVVLSGITQRRRWE